MLNTYTIDERNGIVYIDAEFKGEEHKILISLDKLELVKSFSGKWTIYKDNRRLYARGCFKDEYGKRKEILMHRYITDCPKGYLVDHKNGHGLDNQDENLRIGTYQMNNQNAAMRKDNKTGYRGVSRLKNGKYKATISVEGKNKYLGCFETPNKAAIAYWEAQRTYHPNVERNALPFI